MQVNGTFSQFLQQIDEAKGPWMEEIFVLGQTILFRKFSTPF
jgi:hypothetical protein